MDNKQLEAKLQEIISSNNMLDMAMAATKFNKEYKKSVFYKETKIKLFTLVKYYKLFNLLQFSNLAENIQKVINNLNVDDLMSLINGISEVFEKENSTTLEMLDSLEDFKNIIKN